MIFEIKTPVFPKNPSPWEESAASCPRVSHPQPAPPYPGRCLLGLPILPRCLLRSRSLVLVLLSVTPM